MSGPPMICEGTIAEDYALPSVLRGQRAALVVAHPGHELRLYGWLGLARPTVYVLTDGSGHSGSSRLAATSSLLDAVGAERGCLYGRFTDAAFYAALRDQDVNLFTDLAGELAADLARRRVAYVVGDTIEGYNPTHDVCRALINAAVELVQRDGGQRPGNYGFAVVNWPDASRPHATRLRLDERTFGDKLAAARAYSAWVTDINVMLGEMGAEAFRDEYLEALTDDDEIFIEPPFYEQYGERQVAAGYYKDVLRYRQHVLPITAALREYVRSRCR
ncbi:MAG TPA: hypothetical protein VKA60_03220 [Blastocatellia bacterium]|nr:hypothetical protein [Blastocatellia bacterium]